MALGINGLTTIAADRSSGLDNFLDVGNEGFRLSAGDPVANSICIFNCFVDKLVNDQNDAVKLLAVAQFHTSNAK